MLNPLRESHVCRLDGGKRARRDTILAFVLVFTITYAALFAVMSLHPNSYDESLILTAAMRVAHGQIPHRDFYANYGPAQYYLLAGLFRIFGESVLVERLLDLCFKAALVAFAYVLLRAYCRASVSLWACVGMGLWLFALNALTGTPIVAVALLSLIGSALILPVFERQVSRRRMLLAGAIAGLSALFRYDTGVALISLHACLVAIAIYRRVSPGTKRMLVFTSTFWPYLVGFLLLTVPAAAYYLSRAPLPAFLHDIVVYPGMHYHSGRNLPFPGVRLGGLDNLAVYLPIVIVAFSLLAALRRSSEYLVQKSVAPRPERCTSPAFLFVFGLLALVMYVKGFVRISPIQLFVCIIPSTLLLAVLFQRRMTFRQPVQICLLALIGVSSLATAGGVRRAAKDMHADRASIPDRLLLTARHKLTPLQSTWCTERNPLTRGMCFSTDDGRLRTVEYLDRHTASGEPVFVGVTHHDKIYANDNLIYFAAQRMPATHWSHYDPGLQNDAAIQAQMVRELEASAPPYVVIDSELDDVKEPNDSSRSTGVTVLDEYLRERYRRVEIFSEMSVLQRQPVARLTDGVSPAAIPAP